MRQGYTPRRVPASDDPSRPFSFLDPKDSEALDHIRAEPWLALDTESDPFHRYFERVCLIQLSTRTRDFVFDPLEFEGIPGVLADIVGDVARTVVLHGAESDVRALKQSFRLTVGTIFDTQLAARFLGKEKTGLKDLLDVELGVKIDKGEQRSNWGRRPLTESQIAYARQDTRHLLPLAERLE